MMSVIAVSVRYLLMLLLLVAAAHTKVKFVQLQAYCSDKYGTVMGCEGINILSTDDPALV